jgi:hypothetical protein
MSTPVEWTPAKSEPLSLLQQLHRTVGLAELHGVIAAHRTTTVSEEDRHE